MTREFAAATKARTGGFVDPVDLSAALKPAADPVVVTFGPTAASTQSQMTVSIGSSVPPRTDLVEVRGLSGTLRDTVPLALVVVPGDRARACARRSGGTKGGEPPEPQTAGRTATVPRGEENRQEATPCCANCPT